MFRDPGEPGTIDPRGNPVDSKILHKYLYAGEATTDRIDPTARDIVEDTLVIESKTLGSVECHNTIDCYLPFQSSH